MTVVPAFVPPLIEAELIPSFHQRAQTLNGAHIWRATFSPRGTRWKSPTWLLPNGLAKYAAVFGNAVGRPSPMQWLNGHTIAPYVSSCLAPVRAEQFHQRLICVNYGPRAPQLPISLEEWFTKRVTFCPTCNAEALEHLGFSYVRRDWMLPFVTRCSIHGDALLETTSWTPLGAQQTFKREVIGRRRENGVMFAAAASRQLTDGQGMLEHVGEMLQSRGFTTSKGSLRRTKLADALTRFCSGRFEHPELDALTSCVSRVTKLVRQLGPGMQGIHPLVGHLVLEALRDEPEVVPHLELAESRSEWQAVLRAALESGLRPTKAAELAAVSTTTAVMYAERWGFSVERRSQTLNPDVRELIRTLLLRGARPLDVAAEVGVSLSTVYRVMTGAEGLKRLRDEEAQRAALMQRQQEWLTLLTCHPDASITALRKLAPAAYAFLFRRDVRWLKEVNQSRRRSGYGFGRRTPEGADEALSERIKATRQQLLDARARRSAAGVLRCAGRATNRDSLEALNATRVALLDSLETKAAFVHRRLVSAARAMQERGEPLQPWRVVRAASLRQETVATSGCNPDAAIAEAVASTWKGRK